MTFYGLRILSIRQRRDIATDYNSNTSTSTTYTQMHSSFLLDPNESYRVIIQNSCRFALFSVCYRYSQVRFYVTSDDLQWCMEHLSAPDVVFPKFSQLADNTVEQVADLDLTRNSREMLLRNSIVFD